jgi:fucose permease
MFVLGLIVAMPGALFGIPGFRARLGVDLAQQGALFLALYGGVLVSTLIAGPAIDSYGNKVVLTLSAAVAALSLGAFAAVHAFHPAIAVSFLLGLGGGPLNTSANALVAEIYDDRDRGARLSVVQSFFGTGALTAALLATRVASVPLLWLSSGVVAVCAIAYAALRFPAPRVASGFSFRSLSRAATLPGVMLLALVCFCESGDEAALGGWISTYAGPWALVAYLLPFTLSRLAAAKVSRYISPIRFVIACALLSVVGSAIVVLLPGAAFAGATIAGIAFAPIYPAVLALAAETHQATAGSVFGVLFAIGLSGAVVFPFAVGYVAQKAGMRAGMLLPLIGGLTIAYLGYAAGRRTSNTAPPPSAFIAPTDPP